MRFGGRALGRRNHIQGHLDVHEAPSGQQAVRHRIRLLVIVDLDRIDIVHAIPFAGTDHRRYGLFAAASSRGGSESLDRFDGRFVPFMPDAADGACVDVIKIGAEPVIRNHAERCAVVGKHIAVAVTASADIAEIPVSVERHVHPASNDFSGEYPVSRNIRHNRLVVVVDEVFDRSGNMLLSVNRNRICRFPPYRGFVNSVSRGSWFITVAVESMFPGEHADKDEERCEDEHGPSADKNEQRAERARRIAQNGQNCHYDRLRCGLLRPMFTHTLILRAGETYALIA